MESRSSAENPYDWRNPVRDEVLFAGRKQELSKAMDELNKLAERAGITPLVAITGERRVGKTSFLYRIKEKCTDNSIKSLIIPIDDIKCKSSWDLWDEVFSALIIEIKKEGVKIISRDREPMGFNSKSINANFLNLKDLMFPSAYTVYLSGARVEPSTVLIQSDLEQFMSVLFSLGYKALILIFDEAHLFLDSTSLKQQLRNIIQNVESCGAVFAGETKLARMFSDPSEPFFGQVNVIPLDNFTAIEDIAECCLLPLTSDEAKLMNPMTVQSVARLSMGKPNQVRLICSSIFYRYSKCLQDDLNITIDVLDDILDGIVQAYQDPDLREKVKTIQKLNSIDLEILRNMTKYPNWSINDIVNLDESFRGDCKSPGSISRRKFLLQNKHKQFVNLELMAYDKVHYQLVGGEFLSLYLRFYCETRKYGKLTRKLILGKGPPTPFGEITDKLVASLSYHFGAAPEVRTTFIHNYYRDFGNIFEKVKRRFSVLDQLRRGEKPVGEKLNELISECFVICELIEKEGDYYLLCLSVRNRDNPRQLIQIELYFDLDQQYNIDLISLFNLLNKQSEDARILIDGYTGVWVKLPDLKKLISSFGYEFEDLLRSMPLVSKWRLASVQHFVKDQKLKENSDNREGIDEARKDSSDWIGLYSKGEELKAENCIIQKLQTIEERTERARLYNDLGYIRCSRKIRKFDIGRKDLETALDLHYSGLQLSLLNLSFLDLLENEYDKAIEKIEAALLMTLSPIESDVGYLRYRLPENHLGFVIDCEQHPANIIESAYINLAYTYLKKHGYKKAVEIIEEALELFPSSYRLKHAKARYLIHQKRVDIALPIYREISQVPSVDKTIDYEIKHFKRHITPRKRKKKARRK